MVVNTLLFVVFGASIFHPRTKRDGRAMGAYTAFLVPLFTEMYAQLARNEEGEVAARFGERWDAYSARTPAFWPRQPGTTPRKQQRDTAPRAPSGHKEVHRHEL
uniref:hypothetical protein n=1 Tax=Streptomyces polyasparticus TaxID=2767826 RepID=UPI001F459077|nr:hypothetical protein [Streptomyces polyasparticus]